MEESTGSMSDTTDYVGKFDPEWYLSTYYSSVDTFVEVDNPGKFMMDTAHEFLSSGVTLGDRLLDVGSGPAIHSILSPSRLVQHIDLSDYCPRNLEVLRDWKAGKRSIEREFMVYEMNLAGDRRPEHEREAELRSKVDNIHKIDLTKENVFQDSDPKRNFYGAITSFLCLEAVSTSKEVYISSVRNISEILKPGGHLLLFGVLGQTFYKVGNYRFACATLTSEEIRRIYEDNKFTIVKYKTMFGDELPTLEENEYSDFKDTFAMLAYKQ